jgi:hypothetical protein
LKKSPLYGAVCAVLSFISMSSQAALIPVLGGQAYYDDVADLTWLANANLAGTTMTWAAANTWAAGLNISGVTGWRLPDTLQPDASCGIQSGGVSYGYNCTGSEMGNLFYNVLGGVAGTSISTSHNSNYDLFSNVQSGGYWSSTGYAPVPTGAWVFGFDGGYQFGNFKDDGYYAWAVQSGNAGVVPVPAAVWLFGSGLLGLVGVGKPRRR